MTGADIQLALKEWAEHGLEECKEAYVALKVGGFETPSISVDAIINTRLGEAMVVPQDMVHSLTLPIVGTVVAQEPDGETWKGLLALVEVDYAGEKKIIPAEVVSGCRAIMVGTNFFERFGQEVVLAPQGN
jgi:predicted aspartyl protease